ncbi:MAG: glycosyltransferase family 4 protein [Chthonomonadaceae bacterium]|nr:glycosyltransferase family 4 protein [Chthonomonadaceae bacterium]
MADSLQALSGNLTGNITVAQILRPARGGMKRHVEGLIATSEKTTHLLFAPPGVLNEFQQSRNREIAALIPLDISARPNPLRDRLQARRLSKQLRDSKCEIVHAHGIRGAMIGVPAARIAGLPVIVTLHNLLSQSTVQRLFLQNVLKKSNQIITVSGAIADQINYLRLANPPQIIPNGVDTSEYGRLIYCDYLRQEYKINPKSKIIMGVGRLEKEKGFTLLAGAFNQLRGRAGNVVFVLVGEGTEHGTLLRFAEERNDVVLTGQLKDVRPLMSCADLVVIPSRSEGQSLVALEAMASGVPVIASRVGGLPETLGEEMQEALFNPEDVQDLTQKMIQFMTDEPLRERHKELGLERVREHYELKDQIRKVEAVYSKLVERKK